MENKKSEMSVEYNMDEMKKSLKKLKETSIQKNKNDDCHNY